MDFCAKRTVTVQVAGLVLRLRFASDHLARDTAHRYSKFIIGNEGPAHLSMRIRDLPRSQPSTASAVIRPSGPRCFTATYGSVDMDLDLASGIGEILLPPSVLLVDSALRFALSMLLVEHDGLLLHACGLVHGDRGHVLFGPSGVGKTTVARMVPEDDVLSDEIVLVMLETGSLVAHGTPFYGELGISNPRSAPLIHFARLEHGDDSIAPLSEAAATQSILSCTLCFCPEPEVVGVLVNLAARMAAMGVAHARFRKDTHVPSWLESAA